MSLRVVIYSVLIGTLTFALLSAFIMLLFARQDIIPSAPIVVRGQGFSEGTGAVCSGDEVTVVTTMDILDPSVIELNLSVMDEANTTVWLPKNPVMTVPRSEAVVDVVSKMHWVVPDLPPGNYVRIAAITARNTDSKPIFNNIPFTISDNCP